jgi:rubrerythrin
MAEYIERESLEQDIKQYSHARIDNDAIDQMGFQFVEEMVSTLRIIEKQPTADVVEVKHGEWQEIDNLVIEHGLPTVKGKTWRCSICGEARKNRTAPDMNYCPNCGAKMDLKEGAENES